MGTVVIRPRRRDNAEGGQPAAEKGEIMTKPLTTVRVDALEQAIRTVIHDLRIPKDLRTALAVYQNQRAELNKRGVGKESPQPTRISKAFRLINGYQPENNDNRRTPNSVCSTMEQGLSVHMWIDGELPYWSGYINGVRRDHVTTELMEGLIETAVIDSELSAQEVFSRQPN